MSAPCMTIAVFLCVLIGERRPLIYRFIYFLESPKLSEVDRRIRRDEGQSFRVTANTVVCGAHFKDEDYFGGALLATSSCGKDEKDGHEVPSRKRRLKPDAVPSIFSFRRAQSERPSPTVRRQVAQGRTEKLKLAKNLVTF